MIDDRCCYKQNKSENYGNQVSHDLDRDTYNRLKNPSLSLDRETPISYEGKMEKGEKL